MVILHDFRDCVGLIRSRPEAGIWAPSDADRIRVRVEASGRRAHRTERESFGGRSGMMLPSHARLGSQSVLANPHH